jgi:hypothetical protein
MSTSPIIADRRRDDDLFAGGKITRRTVISGYPDA